MFKGSLVALVTPYKNDEVDVEVLRQLVEFHIENNTSGIIAAGTTGESGTLSHKEKELVIKTVIDAAKERLPVIAGTFANSTKECVSNTLQAMELGADAALIMTPAYIKPTQEGLYEHFASIAHEVALPIILYNVPARTACDLLPSTVARLAKIANIVGIKEATGKLERLKEILNLCEDSLDIYSGDDITAGEWILNGAKGVISVTANVVPKLMADLVAAALLKDKEKVLAIDERLQSLHHELFVEANPIPVKWAMCKMGLINDEIRLPLTKLSNKFHEELTTILTQLNLLKR